MGPDVVTDTSPLIKQVSEAGALPAFELLVIFALCWMVRYLIKRNDDLNKVVTDALVNNTAVISEFKEMVRASLNK